jgi:serine/threonine protein kinase
LVRRSFLRAGAPVAPPNNADRNLLFGILALQMDFITRDGLIAAMQAWVFDKAKPLAELLVERGDLLPGRRDLLEALVEEHLAAHRDDVQASLAAASPPASVARDLRALGDADLDASLAAAGPDPTPESTGPYRPPPAEESTPLRYQVLRRHAKGGLGEVFVASDQELHREVALKEIQEAYAHDPVSRSRFLLEAEITGGLEHPGIVPVYGLGHYPDGRPYYAMRLIRGETLKDAIRAFHAADRPGREPGERSLAFRHLLRRFLDACNAVAYAHNRGVLHRDLKPANIMLGPYGETLVLDWGLAKALGRRQGDGAAEEGTLRPVASDGVAETRAGTALGTPAYMSPEQASGRLDALSPATDVYSLGATLYTLLTGRLPVEEKEVAEVLGRVRRGDIVAPRRVQPRIPRPLEAVCQKAMALNREARYADVLSLAADLEHWLADEPLSACPESLLARGRRWLRQHPALVSSAGAATLALLVCLAAGLGLVSRAYRLEQEARTYAVGQEAEAHRQRRIAEARAAQIEERFRADCEATKQLVAVTLQNASPEIRDDVQARLQRPALLASLGREQDAETGFTRDLAGKYQSIGIFLRQAGKQAEAAAWYAKARSLFEQLATDHRDDNVLALEVADLYLHTGQLQAERGDAVRAWDAFGKALRIHEGCGRQDPAAGAFARDLVLYLDAAGEAFQSRQDARTGLAFHQRALAVGEDWLQGGPADAQFLLALAKAHNGLGLTQRALGQPAEALAHHAKAEAILEDLSRKHAPFPEAAKTLARTYHYAALALAALGKADKARHHYEKAVSLRERLANPNARDRVFTLELGDEYRSLYCLLRDAGEYPSCQTWCERAARTFERLAEDYPTAPEYAGVRNEMLVRRAVTLARLGNHREATEAARGLLAHKQVLPGGLYDTACVFAIAAAKARDDHQLAEVERQRLVESYAAEAVRLLAQAQAAGHFRNFGALAEMKNDPDLMPLGTIPAFKELVNSLEATLGTDKRRGGTAGSRNRE